MSQTPNNDELRVIQNILLDAAENDDWELAAILQGKYAYGLKFMVQAINRYVKRRVIEELEKVDEWADKPIDVDPDYIENRIKELKDNK